MKVTSFLIYAKFGEYHRLAKLVHTCEELKQAIDIIKWSKVEIWKNGQCQNTLTPTSSSEEILNYARFYYVR